MSGASARRDIAQLARREGSATRAGRFLARRNGTRPVSFAQLCAAPRWLVLDEEGRTWVGVVALLLGGRATLAREIDGVRLRAYGAIVGDGMLERILAADDDSRDPLPPASTLAALASAFVRDAERPGGEAAAQRLARAEVFLKEVGVWPSI